VGGSFTVSTNDESGIKVYVMDDTNFVNWQNGHAFSTYYASGEVKAGDIYAEFTSGGTYNLVFDNTFSATSKSVDSEVDVLWTID
jgi:hypothetical protein